jgi:hypothetical protein
MWDMKQIEIWLAAWDSQGIHRSATAGEALSR